MLLLFLLLFLLDFYRLNVQFLFQHFTFAIFGLVLFHLSLRQLCCVTVDAIGQHGAILVTIAVAAAVAVRGFRTAAAIGHEFAIGMTIQ